MTLSQEYFLEESEKEWLSSRNKNSGGVQGTRGHLLGSWRVSSDSITHSKVVPVDRGCCQKDPKISVQRVRFYVSARLEEVDFSDFGRIFTPTVFQWSTLLVSSEKYPLLEDSTLSEWAVVRKSVEFLDFSDLLTLYVSLALTLRE